MTREEAIDVFEGMKCGVFFADCEIMTEAAEVALETLKEQKQGEWIYFEDDDYASGGYNMCSVCNWKFSFGAYPGRE